MSICNQSCKNVLGGGIPLLKNKHFKMDLITKMNEQHMIVRVTGEMSAPLKETFVVSREVTAQQI